MFLSTRRSLFQLFVASLVICSFINFNLRAQQTPYQVASPAATPSAASTPAPNNAASEAANNPGATSYRIAYNLSMPRPQSHLFEVNITVDTVQPTEFVDFQMPMWSPGRYAVFNFAANVQEASARGTVGCDNPSEKCIAYELKTIRVDNQTWRVMTRLDENDKNAPPFNKFTFSYKVFGNDLSGTFSQLDSRHALFNGGSIFMYIVGHKPNAVSLRIEPPSNWRIVNGRMTNDNQRDWQFPNYDEMIDTPTEISPDFTIDEFKLDGKTYRVVVHSFGDEGGRRPQLVKDLERIVRAETALWGAPEFDSYTFLIHFANDGRSGDGMEHLTSTNIIEPGALADKETYARTLSTAAHEFFHVWNVKRLRPAELGPWDFTRPVATRGLWIAEGFTNYYGHLMLRRAGIWDEPTLLDRFGGTIDFVENSPGSRVMSAVESSLSAPLIDGAAYAQRTNLANNSISYYPKGEALALTLDLLIRGRTKGARSLDDVMRRAYQEFYIKSSNDSYYLHGRAYTVEEFERVASEAAGFDLSEFFRRYVFGRETPPYDEALASVGLHLIKTPARESFNAGISIDESDPQNPRIAAVRENSPAERAGLMQDDVIISIGKTTVTTAMWRSALNLYKTGDTVPVTVRRNRQTITTELKLDAPDRFEYRLEDTKDLKPEQRALRAAWLKTIS
jgi:predicted metalloprotease with PDZ domain